jgi:hypothetical protein
VSGHRASTAAPTPGAKRTRAWRQRLKARVAVVEVPVTERMLDILVRNHHLPDRDSADRRRISAAIVTAIESADE